MNECNNDTPNDQCDNKYYSTLILGCQNSEDEKAEIKCIESVCYLLGIRPSVHFINTEQELESVLQNNNDVDFIYLSAHGNKYGFRGEDNDINIEWRTFSEMLCEADVMADRCIVMLSCCRGGLNEIAYTLFYICEKIQYVTGPREELSNCELSTAFQLFLFNKLERNLDAVKSAERVESSIGTRLVCFDRIETESSYTYSKFIEDTLEPIKDVQSMDIDRIIFRAVSQTISTMRVEEQIRLNQKKVKKLEESLVDK